MPQRYQAILLFGAPGSGKGTQGKILGSIPGFYHLSCGEVFRTLDMSSEPPDPTAEVASSFRTHPTPLGTPCLVSGPSAP